MAKAKEIVGFNRSDANAILSMLEQSGGEAVTATGQIAFSVLLGKTKSGGLAANSTGNVFYMQPSGSSPWWTVTTTEYPVFNWGSAIAADVFVLLFPVNGRWFCVELCP